MVKRIQKNNSMRHEMSRIFDNIRKTLQLYIHVQIDRTRKKKEKRKHKIKKAMVTGKRCFSVRIYLNKFNTVAASLTYNG